jgi:hypothetical protein
MTSSAKAEPQGSEPSSTECRLFKGNGRHCLTHPKGAPNVDGQCCGCGVTREGLAAQEKAPLRCKCGHHRIAHKGGNHRCGAGRNGTCGCQLFLCDHTQCGWKPREEPKPCTCSTKVSPEIPHAVGCPAAKAEPKDRAPGVHWYKWSDGLWRDHSEPEQPTEPPLTPEEEEEAPEDCGCGDPLDAGAEHRTDGPCAMKELSPPEGPEYTPCLNCGHIEPEHDLAAKRCMVGNEEIHCGCEGYRIEQPPPQPERRAPYVATYSVGGHLYEVAVSGDACLEAVDGALVIRHGLGPVAGLTGFQPLTIEPQKEGQ